MVLRQNQKTLMSNATPTDCVKAVEAVLKLDLTDEKKLDMIKNICVGGQTVFPQNYRTKNCRYWQQGKCDKGKDCPYIHNPNMANRRRTFNWTTKETDPVSWKNLTLPESVVCKDDGLWITGLTDRKFPEEMRLCMFLKQSRRIQRSKKGYQKEKMMLEECEKIFGSLDKAETVVSAVCTDKTVDSTN